MASTCPKCHQEVDEDIICCAELRHTWRCRECGKRSTGFVVPYGRCFLCGGQNEVVEPYTAAQARSARVIEEAVQLEVDMYQFYRLARRQTVDPTARAVLEQLYFKEQDHLLEIEKKYHVHLDPEVLAMPPDAERLLALRMFKGIDPEPGVDQIQSLYERALMMERRTRDHFARRARELPPGIEREICRELAAEEEEHVALLETELQQFAA